VSYKEGSDVHVEAVFDEFRLLKAPSRMNAITRGNEILAGCSVRSEH
jgi:hypothetical protein